MHGQAEQRHVDPGAVGRDRAARVDVGVRDAAGQLLLVRVPELEGSTLQLRSADVEEHVPADVSKCDERQGDHVDEREAELEVGVSAAVAEEHAVVEAP